jgi:diguanylate cyclase
MWCSWYPGLAVALIGLLRARVGQVPRSLWLDGVMVGCAGTAVYAALLLERFLHAAVAGQLAEEGINIGNAIAYPLGDLVLLALVMCIVAVHGWRLSRSWTCLVVPLLASTVGDGAQLSGFIGLDVAVLVWPPFALMMGFAAWQPIDRVDRISIAGRRVFVAPCAARSSSSRSCSTAASAGSASLSFWRRRRSWL